MSDDQPIAAPPLPDPDPDPDAPDNPDDGAVTLEVHDSTLGADSDFGHNE